MGTLVPADATRDKRSMLNSQVAALEGCTFLRASISGARHLARTCWGDSQVMPTQLHHRGARAVWSSLTPNSRIKSAHKTKGKNPTRPAHRDAVPPARPARAAATALARPLPLATPSRSHNWQHPRPRVCAFDGRAFNSLEFTTRPVRASVSSVPSWKTIAHLVIHFNNPNTPAPRPRSNR